MGFEMLLCPPAPLIDVVRASVGASGIVIGGQDCHAAKQGAHTGDIAAVMLADAGCNYVIVGHSERRGDYGEVDAVVRDKAAAAQMAGLIPLVCVGETVEQREAGEAVEIVTKQVEDLFLTAHPRPRLSSRTSRYGQLVQATRPRLRISLRSIIRSERYCLKSSLTVKVFAFFTVVL